MHEKMAADRLPSLALVWVASCNTERQSTPEAVMISLDVVIVTHTNAENLQIVSSRYVATSLSTER